MNQPYRHISLCSGVGMFDQAAKEAGWENVAAVEINPFGRLIIQKNHPGTKIYEDVFKFNGYEWRGRCEVLSAGFPCQPFSHAGRRAGVDDDRFIWSEIKRIGHEIQPRWMVLENVPGLLSILSPDAVAQVETQTLELFGQDHGNTDIRREYIRERVLGIIIQELEEIGYILPLQTDGTPVVLCVPACALGAPHRRDRVLLVAYYNGEREQQPQREQPEGGRRVADGVAQRGQTDQRIGPFADDIGQRTGRQGECQKTKNGGWQTPEHDSERAGIRPSDNPCVGDAAKHPSCTHQNPDLSANGRPKTSGRESQHRHIGAANGVRYAADTYKSKHDKRGLSFGKKPKDPESVQSSENAAHPTSEGLPQPGQTGFGEFPTEGKAGLHDRPQQPDSHAADIGCSLSKNGIHGREQRGQAEKHGHRATFGDRWEREWPDVAAELCRVDDGYGLGLYLAQLRADLGALRPDLTQKQIERAIKTTATHIRNERLKACGNAVVYQIILWIFRCINETETTAH